MVSPVLSRIKPCEQPLQNPPPPAGRRTEMHTTNNLSRTHLPPLDAEMHAILHKVALLCPVSPGTTTRN